MAFTSEHNATIIRTSGKFSKLNSIVVAYFSAGRYNTRKTFHEFCLHPSVAFILRIDCVYAGNNCTDPSIPKCLLNCLAIKIFVFPQNSTKTRLLMGAVATAGYFQCSVVPISRFINKGLLVNFLIFRKANFWNGNLIRISAGVDLSHPSYLRKYHHNTYMCSKLIMNHKFYDKYMCTFDLMSTIFFAQAHNLSIRILIDIEVLNVEKDFYKIIGLSGNYFKSHYMEPFEQEGLALSFRESVKIIYCPNTKIFSKSTFDCSVWIEPFSLKIWILFIVSFVLVP